MALLEVAFWSQGWTGLTKITDNLQTTALPKSNSSNSFDASVKYIGSTPLGYPFLLDNRIEYGKRCLFFYRQIECSVAPVLIVSNHWKIFQAGFICEIPLISRFRGSRVVKVSGFRCPWLVENFVVLAYNRKWNNDAMIKPLKKK